MKSKLWTSLCLLALTVAGAPAAIAQTCTATAVKPYIKVGTTWTNTASTNVAQVLRCCARTRRPSVVTL